MVCSSHRALGSSHTSKVPKSPKSYRVPKTKTSLAVLLAISGSAAVAEAFIKTWTVDGKTVCTSHKDYVPAWRYPNEVRQFHGCVENENVLNLSPHNDWTMLSAYVSESGKEDVHWIYVSDETDRARCMTNWWYYNKDLTWRYISYIPQVLMDEKGKTWCPLPVYNDLKEKEWEGITWAWCGKCIRSDCKSCLGE